MIEAILGELPAGGSAANQEEKNWKIGNCFQQAMVRKKQWDIAVEQGRFSEQTELAQRLYEQHQPSSRGMTSIEAEMPRLIKSLFTGGRGGTPRLHDNQNAIEATLRPAA